MLKQIKIRISSIKWRSFLLQLLLIVAVFVGVRSWQLRDAATGVAPVIDDRLIDGQSINLQNYRGRPLLVHFWATWCPICKFENASIDAIADDYQVITIASWSEGRQAVKQFMQQQQLDMPVIVDDDGEWASAYGVRGVPASFIVDGEGVIRFTETGFTTETGLRLRLWWLEN